VGGAARLKIPGEGGLTVLTKPGFLPANLLPIATACFEQYKVCETKQEANWTYISPPALLFPGERTGVYRMGYDELVVDQKGRSAISFEDFAVALIDEVELKRFSRMAITVGY
jgi:putative NADH-flavin reductase